MRTTESIAVLGGGVSGLTFAQALVERGFTRVVVFERESEVGGKSCTVHLDGRAHDLGATMGVPIDYRPVVAASRAAGITTEPFPREQHYDLAAGGPVPLNRRRELPAVLAQAAKYVALHTSRWRGADGRGLHHAPPELYAPWAEVVARHGLAAVSRRTLCYRTGYGYGFDDEVPAVLYANLLRPQTLLGLAVDDAFIWRGGTQPIWTALAQRLERSVEIRRGTPILRVARDASGVTVYSRGRAERFDQLVITVDPQVALGVLDASAAERRWFSQVQTYPYSTVACEVAGLSSGRASIGYLDGNMRRDRAGHPMAWVKRYADHDVFVFHLFAPPELSASELARRIGDDVARLGGRLRAVRAVKRWQFFPHFTSAFMQAGGLRELDAWQGAARTHLIGEALSFSTMARVAEHALAYADRFAAMPSAAAVSMPVTRRAS